MAASRLTAVSARCALPGIGRRGYVLTLAALLGATAAGGATSSSSKPKIAHVFFAQQHVQPPDSPYFKLVGNLETLIKVHLDGRRGTRSPQVVVTLTLGPQSETYLLKGPPVLPEPVTDPVMMEHKYEDSFTTSLPREWIKAGLKLTIELRGKGASSVETVLDRKHYDQLNIGAPTRLIMTMFDFHYFGGAMGTDYPKGWLDEFGAKLPIAELEMRRTRGIIMNPIVMQPRGGKPATKCTSREDYTKKTGLPYDGEQDIAGRWNGALKDAAGAGWGGIRRLYYSNIYGVPSGGTAGGLSGRGNGRSTGILLHEMGHAFGLPHWAGKSQYPYVGTMHGVADDAERPHVGPVWAFDPINRVFLSPIHDGKFKNDPMQGGGRNRAGGPYSMTPFSDYSVSRIQGLFERTQVIWDERVQAYVEWDQGTTSYSQRARTRGGANCPVEDDVDVISILATGSLVTPDANIVYPPIGPHLSGRLQLFDAENPASRSSAVGFGYDGSKCHVCLRVTQGAETTTYLVRKGPQPGGDPADTKTFSVFAINLPARDGAVTQVDLLHTPNVMQKGVARDARVLHSWNGSRTAAHKTPFVAAVYPASAAAAPSAATPIVAKKPEKKAPPPPPEANAEAVQRYDIMLMERVMMSVMAGNAKAFFLRRVDGTVRLRGIDGIDVLIVKTKTGDTLKIAWKDLTLADRRSLSMALHKGGDENSHALVAFYSLAIGDGNMAKVHLPLAGAAANAVRAAFK
jgi:hypothetical protein